MFTENIPGLKARVKTAFLPRIRIGMSLRTETRSLMQTIKDVYGITVKMGGETKDDVRMGVKAVDKLRLVDVGALRAVEEELVKYPPFYIRSLGLRDIRLVNAMEMHDDARKEQITQDLAVSDYERIYISTEWARRFPYGNTKMVRELLHHELWHMSDDAYENHTGWTDNDFEYDEVRLGQEPNWSMYSFGFSRCYGMKNRFEDRATIVGGLMTDPWRIFTLAQDDKILALKVDSLLYDLESRTKGALNREYFGRLENAAIRNISNQSEDFAA